MFKKIFDVILGTTYSFALMLCTYPYNGVAEKLYLLGTAFAIGLAFSVNVWNKEEIDKLRKEIEDLTKN